MFDSNAETRKVTCTICSQWLQWCCKVRRMPQGRYPRGVLCAAPTCEQWRASRCPWSTRCPWRSTSCRRRVEPQEGEARRITGLWLVRRVFSWCPSFRYVFMVSKSDGCFYEFSGVNVFNVSPPFLQHLHSVCKRPHGSDGDFFSLFSDFSGILVFEYSSLYVHACRDC